MFSLPLGLSPVSLPDSPGFGLFSPQVIKWLYTDCISCLLTLFFSTLFLPEKVFVFFAFFFFFNFNLITEKGIKNFTFQTLLLIINEMRELFIYLSFIFHLSCFLFFSEMCLLI